MNNKEILNYYEKQIENYDKLSYNDALSLLYIAKKDNDKELLDYIFNGTLHSVLNFIKITKFDLLNSADYDLGDIINTAFEVWYKKITSFELLNYDTLSKALGIKFSNDIINSITASDTELTNLYNITIFNKLVKKYIEMRNESTSVDSKELIFKIYSRLDAPYYLYKNIGMMADILENIYLRLSSDDKKMVDINILSVEKLNKLLFKLGLFEQIDSNYINKNNMEDNILNEDLKDNLKKVMDTLTERENKILRLRFGFNDKPKMLDEVGSIFGFSRERVRQIEAKALRKLRHPSRSKKIKDYGRYV